MVATTRVEWPQTYRIIRSIHPPIELFEDIADPRDWEALASAERKNQSAYMGQHRPIGFGSRRPTCDWDWRLLQHGALYPYQP